MKVEDRMNKGLEISKVGEGIYHKTFVESDLIRKKEIGNLRRLDI
jgi:hypothetical protein